MLSSQQVDQLNSMLYDLSTLAGRVGKMKKEGRVMTGRSYGGKVDTTYDYGYFKDELKRVQDRLAKLTSAGKYEALGSKVLDRLFEGPVDSSFVSTDGGRQELAEGKLQEIANELEHGSEFEYWTEGDSRVFMWDNGVYHLSKSDTAAFNHLLAHKNVKWVPAE